MPTAPTYPGVYIEEIPSGVRTITGVATSITAFVGVAPRGPVNDPVFINSFGDYERRFGGLDVGSTMSYAVRDFYQNGGSQAIIVRVAGSGAGAAALTLLKGAAADPAADTTLEASSVGTWGAGLRADVDHATKDPANVKLFNLTLSEAVSGGGSGPPPERHLNVSTDPANPRYLPRVLEQASALARVRKSGNNFLIGPDRPKVQTGVAATGGAGGSTPTTAEITGSIGAKTGVFALEKADLFNLLCIPPPTRDADTHQDVYKAALKYCMDRRAFLIVDPQRTWGALPDTAVTNTISGVSGVFAAPQSRNGAIYFPLVVESDPLRDNQLDAFVPCGVVAGVMAATDAARGVWKAPAGLDAGLNGVSGLQVNLTDLENGQLNQLGINCLRSFPVNGRVVWGARTLRGADAFADEYKYVPVRRLALFLEESLYRGTQWVVFEPNDEPLWSQIRLNVGAFMQNLFRQGAFQGKTPREAYLVKCDKETTTQNDINLGIVNILVGFAPLKPAEFVIIKIQQLAGQIAT